MLIMYSSPQVRIIKDYDEGLGTNAEETVHPMHLIDYRNEFKGAIQGLKMSKNEIEVQ